MAGQRPAGSEASEPESKASIDDSGRRTWRWTAFLTIAGVVFALGVSHEKARALELSSGYPLLYFGLVAAGLLVAFLAALCSMRAAFRLGWVRAVLTAGAFVVVVLPIGALALFVGLVNVKSAIAESARPSAELSFDPRSAELRIDGRIGPSLHRQVRLAFEDEPGIARVVINSPGGVSLAAEETGRYLGDRNVPVRIDGRCASACVVIWASAERREMTLESRVGLHQSHLGDGRPATGLVASTLKARQEDSNRILARAGFSEAMLAKATTTPANEVYWANAIALASDGVRFRIFSDDGRELALHQAMAEHSGHARGSEEPSP